MTTAMKQLQQYQLSYNLKGTLGKKSWHECKRQSYSILTKYEKTSVSNIFSFIELETQGPGGNWFMKKPEVKKPVSGSL